MSLQDKLEQVIRDQVACNNSFDTEIADLKQQIADAEKVKLKNGDYGHDSHSNRHAPADARVFINGHHYGCYGGDCDNSPLEFVVGNIFDNLRKLKK